MCEHCNRKLEGYAMALMRRSILKTAGAAAAIGASRQAKAADSIVVTGFGGEYRDIFLDTVVKPFEKKFSVQVVYDDSGGVDPYPRVRATRGSPGFDVMGEANVSTIILGAKEKLLEPITEAQVPNLKYAFTKSRTIMPAFGAIQSYQYLALIWDKNKIKQPESWLDYWQPQPVYGDAIKGHLVSHGPANFSLLIYAMIMGARSKGDSGTDPAAAWDMLREQKPYIGFVAASSAQAVPYMENEQVWLMPFWSGRAFLYAARGMPYGVTIPKEGTIALANCCAVPIGAANKKLAFEFINFRLDPDIQRAFCTAYQASPGRPDITDWPPGFADRQITTEEKMATMVFPDDQMIAQKQREWTLRWQEIMSA
jgi:putative spermidine/putrescine transport system substrate-binding protein